jgi:Cu-processing system permease protein
VSVAVRDRGTAGGIAIGIWLLLVLIYDMALLGALVADQGKHITAGVFNHLLLLNPADVYRLFNLTGFKVSAFSGMAGLAEQAEFGRATLLAALVAWIVAPLALAALLFRRRQL